MKPGIYPNLPNAEYHKAEGLSSTDIKALRHSGLHYQAYLKDEIEQSGQMRLGSLVHCLILTPDKLKDDVHVGNYNTRRGKDFEAACRDGGDKLICNQEELDRASEIADAFRAQAIDHPFFNGERFKLLEGYKEHSIFVDCPETGLLLKARPDVLTTTGVITDIKTTDDASPDGFQKSIAKFGYHISAAHYIDVVSKAQIEGIAPVTEFCFVAIETSPPYAMATYFLSVDALQAGAEEIQIAIENYKKGKQSGVWEGYKKDLVEIGLPGWYHLRLEANRGGK